mgnify:CR=1 FL=1
MFEMKVVTRNSYFLFLEGSNDMRRLGAISLFVFPSYYLSLLSFNCYIRDSKPQGLSLDFHKYVGKERHLSFISCLRDRKNVWLSNTKHSKRYGSPHKQIVAHYFRHNKVKVGDKNIVNPQWQWCIIFLHKHMACVTQKLEREREREILWVLLTDHDVDVLW